MDTINENKTNLIVAEPSISEFKSIIKDITSNPNIIALKERIQLY